MESFDLVRSIKEAILRAGLDRLKEGQIAILGVDIDLRLDTEVTAGGEVKLKIPIVEIEVGRTRTEGNVSEVHIELLPPELAARATAQADDPIVAGLAAAASTIFEAVAIARMSEPVYDLKEASYSISFVITDKGSVSMLFKGEAVKEATQKVTFKFGRYEPPSQ